MLGHTFYHNTIRRYVILFGTLFNDIHINRVDTGGSVTQTIKVPISYGKSYSMKIITLLFWLTKKDRLERSCLVSS